MEITSRQFGQIEASCFALEEATEKNNTALRLVKVIKDNLAEIAKTAYPLELVFEFEEQELPMGLACPHATGEPGPVGPSAAKALEGKQVDEIRLYGQELINQGATMKELIKMVMEHFALTQDAFALENGYDDVIRTEHTPDKDGILRRISDGVDVPGAELIPAGDVAKMSFKKGYAEQLENF